MFVQEGQILPDTRLSFTDVERIRASLNRERAQNAAGLEEERLRAEKGRHRKESLARVAIAEVRGFAAKLFRPLGRVATAVVGFFADREQTNSVVIEQAAVVTPEPTRRLNLGVILVPEAPRKVDVASLTVQIFTAEEQYRIFLANEAANGNVTVRSEKLSAFDQITADIFTREEQDRINAGITAGHYGPISNEFVHTNRE